MTIFMTKVECKKTSIIKIKFLHPLCCKVLFSFSTQITSSNILVNVTYD